MYFPFRFRSFYFSLFIFYPKPHTTLCTVEVRMQEIWNSISIKLFQKLYLPKQCETMKMHFSLVLAAQPTVCRHQPEVHSHTTDRQFFKWCLCRRELNGVCMGDLLLENRPQLASCTFTFTAAAIFILLLFSLSSLLAYECEWVWVWAWVFAHFRPIASSTFAHLSYEIYSK